MHPPDHQEPDDLHVLRALLARLDRADAEAYAGIEDRAEHRKEILMRLGEEDEPALTPARRKAALRWGAGGSIIGVAIGWITSRAREHTAITVVTVGATATTAIAAVFAPALIDDTNKPRPHPTITAAPAEAAEPPAATTPPAKRKTPTPAPTTSPPAAAPKTRTERPATTPTPTTTTGGRKKPHPPRPRPTKPRPPAADDAIDPPPKKPRERCVVDLRPILSLRLLCHRR